ncbi:siroheme decarboxylase subunit beta [Methanoregula sp.]|uniref:siroheme decarboxylase subunit beta n=1 Tax=Methanoregula sp. TaxID=2052170 RepID=UPI002BDD4751|nr:siroheme decarboxylase subunit beta [Methanoregula sp.]HVP97614.1 siroheme decarboxylase subunit beta [Methanoregula sp.]
MDPADMKILAALEDGLPLVPEPFVEIGRKLGLTGDEVLERTQKLLESGVIRRFRARINQRQVGISANALVAWHCNGEPAEKAGAVLASYPSVTHCYERRPVPGRWDYSLYTVHHGRSREAVEDEVRKIAGAAGLSDYLVLFSTEEYKRVPHVRVNENGRGS